MQSILVLHGPNMNLLGIREPEVYGFLTQVEITNRLEVLGEELGIEVRSYQSNSEGALIDSLHNAQEWAVGVAFNPGAFTHSSYALRDAIVAIRIPVIEVHLSNVYAREEFRHTSLLAPVCLGVISGFGWNSYQLALRALIWNYQRDKS
jgi:3-dehydroquinate dehydratase-2